MDTITRRSRFIVDPKGGSYTISKNHLAILSLFDTYEYIPSTYIAAFVPWLNPVYVKNRLTILRHEQEFLEVPAASWQAANARYRPAVYRRTKKGTQALIERGHSTFDVRSGETFPHAFGVNLIAASFDLGVRAHPGLSLISDTDILDHPACPAATRNSADPFRIDAPFSYKGRNGNQVAVEEAHIMHDWYPMGIAHTIGDKTVRIFMPGVEFDRNSEPGESRDHNRSSIVRKFSQILGLFKRYDGIDGYQEHYGIPNSVIPFWTINKQHMLNMMDDLDRITNGRGSDRILFAHMNDFSTFEKVPEANGWALACDYKRVGFKDYNFLEELGIKKP